MRKKRILITHLAFGNGHKAVSNYIKRYFEDHSNKYEIQTIDILDFSNGIFKTSQQKLFNFASLQFPFIWTGIYKGFNNRFVGLANILPKYFMYNKRLRDYIIMYNPDLVISTHYYGSYIIEKMILKHEIDTKLITVVTDYDRHRIWLNGSKVEEAVTVGCKDTKKFFVKNKLNRNIVQEFGIPIYPIEDEKFDRNALKEQFQHPEYPICLFFSGGGAGNNRSYNYIKKALKNELKINFIYIAGKNEKALNKVKNLIKENNYKNIIPYGFVTNVGDYLKICDFVVSKPGGIQTTEALSYGKPMMTILSAGGQENYNLHYLKREKYGKYFHTSTTFNRYLKKISDNPSIIKEYQENIKKGIMNDAMEKLFKFVENTI